MIRQRFADSGFSVVLGVLAIGSIVYALRWPWQVSLVPIVTASVFGAIALWDLFRTVSGRGSTASTGFTMDLSSSFGDRDSETQDVPGLAAWRGAIWFAGVIALVLLLGLQAGLTIAILLLCRFAFHQRWTITIGTVIALVLVLWGFDYFFHVFWPTPLLLGGSLF